MSICYLAPLGFVAFPSWWLLNILNTLKYDNGMIDLVSIANLQRQESSTFLPVSFPFISKTRYLHYFSIVDIMRSYDKEPNLLLTIRFFSGTILYFSLNGRLYQFPFYSHFISFKNSCRIMEDSTNGTWSS